MEEGLNILIVEDEAIEAMALQSMLENEGYRVVGIVDEGMEAIQCIQKEPVDLVLLDIHIRGALDGVETAERLSTIKDIPFIFVTAFSDEDMINRAKATSPYAYLIKPYRIENLLVAIDLAMYNYAVGQKGLRQKEEEKKEPLLLLNNSVFIKQNYKYIKIQIKDILFLNAEGNYTIVNTLNAKYLIRYSINMVLEKLSWESLIRVHRSYAINVDYLVTFNSSAIFINEYEIPLGRNYKDDFFKRLRLM